MKTTLCDPRAEAVLARLDDQAKHQAEEIRGYYDAKRKSEKRTTDPDPSTRDSELARSARRMSGLTQQGLADLLGIHRVTVSGWETGAQSPGPVARALLVLVLARPRESVATLRVAPAID